MDAVTKTGIDAAKAASKRVVRETAEATADLIGNNIADKITSVGKAKSKEKENETNLLDTTSASVPRFINKKWIKIYDQSGSAEDRYKPSKQIRFKTPMLSSDLGDFSNAYIVVEGNITANFNPAKVYDNNGFLDEIFPDNAFPNGSRPEQITAARNAAKTATINDANNNLTSNLIKGISFRNNASFTNCILKINNVLSDDAEDLDVAMPVYNLLEYRKNYEKTTGSLWNYYRDEPTSDGEINY